MIKKLSFLKRYLIFKLKAKHKNGHGIHSPFIYNFLTEIIENENENFYSFFEIEKLRFDLLKSKEKIKVKDFGAGSKKNFSSKWRKISDITKYSSQSSRFGKLLFRIVNEFKPKTILEIGTSFGIGTSYLAKVNSKNKIFTLEGCEEIINIAKKNFKILKLKNIFIKKGEFSKTIPEVLREIKFLDFVFFDGNHRKKQTLEYFNICLKKSHEKSIFIFDDIHWSKEMEEAWEKIKENEKVKVSLDLFFIGIIFFRKNLQKQNYVINF